MKRSIGVSIAAAAATFLMIAGTAGASPVCDLVASPGGSDSAAGTVAAPFQTAQKLVSSLAPGQVGCLRAGTYNESVKVSQGGTAGAPITLSSYPGETATITGRFWIARGADNVTVTHVNLDGRNADSLPSPSVTANNATFSYDDVTNEHTAICFSLGDSTWGSADGTVITHSRVHDCGLMPAQNYSHGIYVDDATHTTISWNLIYDNADRGIQLYPNAQYTTVDHNILYGNGENILFSGDGSSASSSTNVYANVLADARVRSDAESWYPSGSPVGTGNLLHNNCVWGGREGTINTSSGGFSSYGNQNVNPLFVDAAANDYHLQATSPCLAMTGDVAAAVDGGTAVVAKAGIARVAKKATKHARRHATHRRRHHRKHSARR